jgi:tetratricopeptide (TPR) repeat protein
VNNACDAALIEAEEVLSRAPADPQARANKAAALEAMEDYGASAEIWRTLISDFPDRPDLRIRYGHALRSMGARADAISAYRDAIALNPATGGAWWSLADLKTFRFSLGDIATMEAHLAGNAVASGDRERIHFALGKAYADLEQYDRSFAHYAKGNALHRLGIKHDPDVLSSYVSRCKRSLTKEFFQSRRHGGCDDASPIFLVGMARAGSTLVEQILASHSRIEGTRELSDLASLFAHIQSDIIPRAGAEYPAALTAIPPETLRELGQRYLETTRKHRKLGRPFFLDKMGANFVHVGLLQLILPRAKIVDVRRHPMACGFSIFAQLFPQGQNDSYRLTEIGRLYRDYVELMEHFDRVLPGKIHRIFYEDLVAEPEKEIRRMLDYLELPFEESCLRFHQTDRVVTTASSEQVRRPIYRDSIEQWRHYEPWLEPLKRALGPVLDAYPGIPSF